MSTTELLQQIGLNKYEAEAYYTLLCEGPLTGYELGKRSQVPLSRSYEILERLTQKGLALLQPGDPPRYLAEEPAQFLGHVRTAMTEKLDVLANALAALSHPDRASEFWVVRGRQHILNRAQAMIAGAQRAVALYLPAEIEAEMAVALALSQANGCQLFRPSFINRHNPGSELILLVDAHEALVGTLVPADHCQAVVSANSALVTALQEYFGSQLPDEGAPTPAASLSTDQPGSQLDWLAWEERKQRRLWNPHAGNRVA